jgi:hypothetical protein
MSRMCAAQPLNFREAHPDSVEVMNAQLGEMSRSRGAV